MSRSGVENRVKGSYKVIAHIDMDCFYVQVERSLDPTLLGVPCAVVQYNPFGDLSTVLPTDNRRVNNNGSLIAVSYEARAAGVNRFMRGTEAKKVCPELHLIQVPVAHGKADINIYRNAGEKVVEVISSRYRCVVEKASVDEVYIDITEEAMQLLNNTPHEAFMNEILRPVIDSNVIISLNPAKTVEPQRGEGDSEIEEDGDAEGDIHDICSSQSAPIVIPQSISSVKLQEPFLHASTDEWLTRPMSVWFGSDNEDEKEKDRMLVCASLLVSRIRKDIFEQLGFTCSAGIAHTKLIAKVASAMNKPNKQTIVPLSFIPAIMNTLPLSKIKGFGGKLGSQIKQDFGITLAGELCQLGEAVLSTKYDLSQCKWMISAAKGELDEPLTPRVFTENVTCGKTFRGATGLPILELMSTHEVSPNSSTSPDLTLNAVYKWVKELSEELFDRLTSLSQTHSRIAKKATVAFTVSQLGNPNFSPIRLSASFTLPAKYTSLTLSLLGYNHIRQCISRSGLTPSVLPACRITSLFLSGNSFETRVSEKQAIDRFFSAPKTSQISQQEEQISLPLDSSVTPQSDIDGLPQNIDPEVFNSLPESLQEELRDFYKNQNSSKKRSLRFPPSFIL